MLALYPGWVPASGHQRSSSSWVTMLSSIFTGRMPATTKLSASPVSWVSAWSNWLPTWWVPTTVTTV
ncbi:hypothetical protein DPMN_004305 [Dreissena polymorpha]|uniref:Uncharacterized protein n=1 Tax=Dreissena polymorpha TaxID=45954 RepID=A0A9D4MRI4_DREPO|nr:hypothetical protein DPMN_004305 [Dreissena polymorpha]